MAEPYIIRPRSFNYKSGYEYDDANHKATLAIDNDINTYWLLKSGLGSGDRTFYNFDFSQIPNTEKITDLVFRIRKKAKYTNGYYAVKKAYAGSYSAPDTSEKIDDFTDSGDATKITEVISPSLTNSIAYLNNNRNAFYGLYVKPLNSVISSSPSEFYDIALYVYTDKSSLIYNGSSNITSAYLGSTKLNGIYLGSQKLL